MKYANQHPEIERRAFHVREVRAAQNGDKPTIEGYAAVFGQQSEDLGGFIEIIEAGFFDDVLDQDVRALWNHDDDHVLGRTKSGTLELKQDATGLYQVTYPPVVPPDAAQWAQDALVTIKRGDVDQMSFAFMVKRQSLGDGMDGDEWMSVDGKTIRVLKKGGCKELLDVSPVTYPAYTQTNVSANTRSRFEQFQGQQKPSEPGGADTGDDDIQADRRRRILQLMEAEN
jgi:HK97 family phage prohead protease